MIVPNKAISYDTSLLSKLPEILYLLKTPMSPTDLYHKLSRSFEDISQFLLTLDTLFVLGRITLINGDLKLC